MTKKFLSAATALALTASLAALRARRDSCCRTIHTGRVPSRTRHVGRALGQRNKEHIGDGRAVHEGSDPEDGHLIYYVPWGNIGFYYDANGVGYSDQTLHLGTYNATVEQLERLEGKDVTVQIVR